MDHKWRSHSFQPTLRQHMILIIFAALLLAIPLPAMRQGRPDWRSLLWMFSCWACPAPFLLATLVLLFDRPGNVRRWIAMSSASLAIPVVCLYVDLWFLYEPGDISLLGILILVVLNFALYFWITRFVPFLYPARCPRCGSYTLIPALGESDLDGPPCDIRECARCDARFRRMGPQTWDQIPGTEPVQGE